MKNQAKIFKMTSFGILLTPDFTQFIIFYAIQGYVPSFIVYSKKRTKLEFSIY